MTRLRHSLGLVLLLVFSLVQAQTTDDRYVIKRTAATFQGSCRTGQVGMAPNSGQTFVCVSGQWARNDLPSCGSTAPTGTCDTMSMCLLRSSMTLYGCSATNVWTSIVGGTGGGGGGGSGEFNYSQTFTSQTTVTLSHNLGTPNVLVSCYDTSDIQISPDTITIGAADPWDIAVGFALAQSGRCVVNGSGNGTTGGGGGGGGTSDPIDIREDGAARVNDAAYINFLSGFDVDTLGNITWDPSERPVSLTTGETSGILPISKGGTNAVSFTPNTCIRYNGTSLVSAGADCNTGGGGGGTATDLNCSGCVSLGSETSGSLPVYQGGTGITSPGTNYTMIGSLPVPGSWRPLLVPACNSISEKLMYRVSPDQGFYCTTDQSTSGGSTPQGPEGAIQFYEGGILGSNATLYWTEATSALRAPILEASNMYRGSGSDMKIDIDRDGSYDVTFGQKTPESSYFMGFPDAGSYISWRGVGDLSIRWSPPVSWFDFDGDSTRESSDLCIIETGVDQDCNGAADLNTSLTAGDSGDDFLLISNTAQGFVQKRLPQLCGGSISWDSSANSFGCVTSGSGSGYAKGIDFDQNGANGQVEIVTNTVEFDPAGDGTTDARVNSDGSFDTLSGTANTSGGMSSDGKLIFTADLNNDNTSEGFDFNPSGDGTAESTMDGSGNLKLTVGAFIPGVCSSVTPAGTTTADNCNVVTFTATTTTITTLNTCNAANLGRSVTFLCNSSGQTFGTGGNIKPVGAASFACAADDTYQLICDGTNWREISRSAN